MTGGTHGDAMGNEAPPGPATVAERVKRHRQRRRAGYVSLRVDVNAETLLWLADNGWIGERDKLDRAKLSEALSDVLYCLGNGTLIANIDKL